jgi:hypothetical protein
MIMINSRRHEKQDTCKEGNLKSENGTREADKKKSECCVF